MANKFTISTIFTATDRLTGPTKRIVGKVEGHLKRVNRAFGRIASVGIAGVAIAAAAAAREFIYFDQALTASSAKFSDMNLATKEGQARLEELGKTARAVGAATQFTATQAAEGLDFLAMAGFNSVQAMASLPGVVDLATVGQIELARATDIASDTLGAFGLMTEDSTQLQKNFTRINDVMAKTITATNTDLETLFESIKKGAPSFTAAGQSLETFTAFAGVMASAGVKGAESGTQLRNMMLRLAKPSAEAAGVMKKLGIQTADADGNFLDAIDILAQFEKRLDGMGTAQRSAALSTIFGARSVTGISIMLKAGTREIRTFRASLIASGGAAKQMSDIMRSSLLNRLQALKSAAIEVGFQFLDKIKDKAAGAITRLTEVVRELPIEKVIEKISRAIKAAMPIIRILIKALSWMVKNLDLIVIGYIGLIAAQWALNAAMAGNIVGGIIAGFMALVALTLLIITKWEEITSVLGRVWKAVNKIFNNPAVSIFMAVFMQPLFLMLSVIQTIIDLINGKGLKAFANMGGIFIGLARIFTGGKGGASRGWDAADMPISPGQTPNRGASRGWDAADMPISPNAGVIESHILEERRQYVDITVAAEPGTKATAKTRGRWAAEIGLDTGFGMGYAPQGG